MVELGLTVPSGRDLRELEKYPATRQVLEERQAISVKVDHPTDNRAEQDWLREHGLSAA